MSVNVSGDSSLHWDASIGMDNFDKSIQAIIEGLNKTAKVATDSATSQNEAFLSAAKSMNVSAEAAKKMQAAFEGYNAVKKHISELKTELDKLKNPEFLQGKSAEEILKINRYIAQQEELYKDLIQTQAEYVNELNRLAKTPIEISSIQMPQVTEVSSVISTKVLDELKQAFGEIDAPTQKFIEDLIALELKLQDLRIAQNELDTAYSQGQISQEEYAQTSSFLVAGIAEINKQTETLTDNQKKYEENLKASNGSISEKKAALASLRDTYENLNEAQRKSPEGENINKQIIDLKKEIDGLEPGKIQTAKEKIITVQTELRRLQELMARNPNSPMFGEWKKQAAELKESLVGVKEGVEQATNSTAGVSAFAEGLRGLIGGFEAGTGIIGLFTDNTEDFERVTKNAASALALMNGVQELSNVLSKSSALNVYLLGLMRKSNTVATTAETTATVANTAAMEAQAGAATAAATAHRGLMAAMLANPAALVISAIAAIAGAYLLLRKREEEAKTSAQLLEEANKKVNDTYAERMAKVLPLVEAIKQGNLSEQQSIEVHKQLADIDEKLVAGLDKKALSYDQLSKNVKLYTDALRDQYKLETNKEAITQSIAIEEKLQKEINANKTLIDLKKEGVDLNKITNSTSPNGGIFAGYLASFFAKNPAKEVDNLTKQLEKQKKVTEELVGEQAKLVKPTDKKVVRGTEVIDKEISDLKKEQGQLAANSKAWEEYEKKIKKLEEERKKITGPSDKELSKAARKEQSELNALLQTQKSLLEDIQALHRDSLQSGLTKEQSELDKINEKYDLAVRKVGEYNAKVADFNKKYPGRNVSTLSTQKIEEDRKIELQNATFKKNAEDYKKYLGDQQKAFEEYEDAKKEVGEKKAKEMFGSQAKGFESYLDFLKQQQRELEKSVQIGPSPEQNLETQLKLKALKEAETKEEERILKEKIDNEIEAYKTLLRATITFQDQRLAIEEKYNALEAALAKDATISPEVLKQRQQILKDAKQQELTDLEDNIAHQSELYKTLNADLIRYTKEQLKERLALLKQFLKDGFILEKDGTRTILTPQMKKDLQQGINDAENLLGKYKGIFNILGQIGGLGDVFSSLGQSTNSQGLQDLGTAISTIIGNIGNLQKALNDFKSSSDKSLNAEKIGSLAGSALQLVTMIIDASRKRKEETERYYASVIRLQNDYNLALNDQIRLQSQLRENVFVKNYEGQMLDGIRAAHDANINYQKALAKLNEGFAKDGQKKAINWGNVAAGAATGAVVGAEVGGWIGAIVGLVVGGVIGIFAKKNKDVWVPLLGKYPELIQKMADGTEKFNAELAKSLIQNNLVDDATKAILDNVIAWDEKLQKAREQIKGVVSELAGSLGDDLRNSLVAAFEEGTSSAKAFGDSVNKVLENILSNLLFNQVFSKAFDQLQSEMEKSFDIGGDSSWVDDIARFFENAPGLIEQFNQALADANAESLRRGLNVFGKKNTAAADGNSLQGAIKGITQQQADLLAGQFSGLRLTAFEALNVARAQLNVLNQIANNTSLLIQCEAYLRYFRTVGIHVI